MKFSSLPYATEGWEIVAQETHFANEHLAVVSEDVRTPNRPEVRKWTVVQRKAAVGIAALTPAGELLLIRPGRIPVQAATRGIPWGPTGGPGPTGFPAHEPRWRARRGGGAGLMGGGKTGQKGGTR